MPMTRFRAAFGLLLFLNGTPLCAEEFNPDWSRTLQSFYDLTAITERGRVLDILARSKEAGTRVCVANLVGQLSPSCKWDGRPETTKLLVIDPSPNVRYAMLSWLTDAGNNGYLEEDLRTLLKTAEEKEAGVIRMVLATIETNKSTNQHGPGKLKE